MAAIDLTIRHIGRNHNKLEIKINFITSRSCIGYK